MANVQFDNDKENCGMPNLKKKSQLCGAIIKQPLAVKHGNVPSSEMGVRQVTKLKVDAKACYGDAKKSKVVPVVEQIKSFSVYEDNVLSQLPMQEKKDDDAQMESLLSLEISVVDVSDIANFKAANAIGDAYEPRNDRQRLFEVVQYQQDILEHFRESEKKYCPNSLYMLRQVSLNHAMRASLVEWLVEVADECKLDTETLYLSVSYVDRFLSQILVQRSELQLVGTAAMYIASKYEEINLLSIEDLAILTDNTYTKAEILRMENRMLMVLAFQLSTPTAYVFINTYAVISDMPEKVKHLTLYISELALREGDTYMQYLPSLMSSAALALARRLLEMPMWSLQLEEITTYSVKQLKRVIVSLSNTHKTASGLIALAVREKYNKKKFNKVASIEPIDLDESEI